MPIKMVPPAHRILIKPDKTEDEEVLDDKASFLAKQGFHLAKLDGQDRRDKMAIQKGTVVDIGWMAWKSIDSQFEGWKPWCKVGDRILFGQYAGQLFEHPETKEEFMLINDVDVLLVLQEEA